MKLNRSHLGAGALVTLSFCYASENPVLPKKAKYPTLESVAPKVNPEPTRLGERNELCREVIEGHNDMRRKGIDVVFVGIRGTKEKEFELSELDDNINKVMKSFSSIDILESNKDNFRFWKVNKIGGVDNHTPKKDEQKDKNLRQKADSEMEKLAEACGLENSTTVAFINWAFTPNAYGPRYYKYVNLDEMNLSDIEKFQTVFSELTYEQCSDVVEKVCPKNQFHPLCEAVESLRGKQDKSLDEKICSIITPPKTGVSIRISLQGYKSIGKVFLHEIGHSFFDLRNEYLIKGEPSKPEKEKELLESIQKYGRNCYPAKTQQECLENAPWKDYVGQEGTGCYPGCNHVLRLGGMTVWRSIDNGIMNRGVNTYGIWNEVQICNVFKILTGNPMGKCKKYMK